MLTCVQKQTFVSTITTRNIHTTAFSSSKHVLQNIRLLNMDPVLQEKNQNVTLSQQNCSTTSDSSTNSVIEPWETLVDYDALSAMDLKIHQRHREAVKVMALCLCKN